MMKIRIAFIGPINTGIGGGDRKFKIYFNNLDEKYFEKYFLYITKDSGIVDKNNNIILETDILEFLESKKINFVYFSGRKIDKDIENNLLKKYIGIINVNFSHVYREHPNILNFVISKSLYCQLEHTHNLLKNSYVVYNPIDFENRINLSNKNDENYRNYFHDKKFIIGRLARAEPSKRHFLIISTLYKLQKQKNYNYGFIFTGMPFLYKKVLKLILNKNMYNSILFLPELRELSDITKFYKSIDIFWQVSIGETFGNVIAEAFCFNVPVITDYKNFYKNGKVDANLNDAQIELVDHGINGRYCQYPQNVINFLEKNTMGDIHKMGKCGYDKVKNIYNVKLTSNTIARILYEEGKKRGIYNHEYNFELLNIIPTDKEVSKFFDEYLKKINIAKENNKIGKLDFILYKIMNISFNVIEHIYLIIRYFFRKIFKKDLEKL